MRKKILLIYKSISGNTKEIADHILNRIQMVYPVDVQQIPLERLDHHQLQQCDGFILGTYTWGNGELPDDVKSLYLHIESCDHLKQKITGVFGSGDKNYPHFCRAVDVLADMLCVKTRLALKMKIELNPRTRDIERCRLFAERFMEKLAVQPKPLVRSF